MSIRNKLLKRYWDHAFASGAVQAEPKTPGLLGNLFFPFLESWYGRYCSRKVWREFKQNAQLGKGVLLGADARLINRHNKESVNIGNNVVIRGIIRIERNGVLEIEDDVYVGDNTIISVADKVVIGRGTLLAHGAQIFDNTSHPMGAADRAYHFRMLLGLEKKKIVNVPHAPVTIGRDCWLAFNSAVLKGVTIGDRSIVAGGCMVTKDAPADSLIVSGAQKAISLDKIK